MWGVKIKKHKLLLPGPYCATAPAGAVVAFIYIYYYYYI